MRRTSGPAAASNSFARPRLRRIAMPDAAMNSPHTFRRGKVLFSATTTSRPARASRAAAVAPAGPAPMMRMSGRTLGNEEMAEGWCAALIERPRCRPERRELATGEARAHADHRIVARDVVRADEPHQAAAEQGERRAARLARRDQSRS